MILLSFVLFFCGEFGCASFQCFFKLQFSASLELFFFSDMYRGSIIDENIGSFKVNTLLSEKKHNENKCDGRSIGNLPPFVGKYTEVIKIWRIIITVSMYA